LKNGCPESCGSHGKELMVSEVLRKGVYRTETTIIQLNVQEIGITEIYIEDEQKDGHLRVHSVQRRFTMIRNGLHISQVIVG